MRIVFLLFLISISTFGFSQTNYNVSKLDLCLIELKNLEKEIKTRQVMYDLQTKDVYEMKHAHANDAYEIENLKKEKERYHLFLDDLFTLAYKEEKKGNVDLAESIYRLLISNYPDSFASANARSRLGVIYNNKKDEAKKKK